MKNLSRFDIEATLWALMTPGAPVSKRFMEYGARLIEELEEPVSRITQLRRALRPWNRRTRREARSQQELLAAVFMTVGMALSAHEHEVCHD